MNSRWTDEDCGRIMSQSGWRSSSSSPEKAETRHPSQYSTWHTSTSRAQSLQRDCRSRLWAICGLTWSNWIWPRSWQGRERGRTQNQAPTNTQLHWKAKHETRGVSGLMALKLKTFWFWCRDSLEDELWRDSRGFSCSESLSKFLSCECDLVDCWSLGFRQIWELLGWKLFLLRVFYFLMLWWFLVWQSWLSCCEVGLLGYF